MKKFILCVTTLFATNIYSQNTIPTTTVTGALKINDSLRVNKTITAKGEVIVKDTMRAKKDVIVDGNVTIGGKLKVDGNVRFKDDVRLDKGFTFDGTNGLYRTAATATSGEIIKLGNNSAKPLPFFYCQAPNSEPWNQFYYNGNFVSYLPAGSSTNWPLVDAAVRIGIAPWNGNGVIDVSGVSSNGLGTNGLEINTFCKRNTYINNGWDIANGIDGGRVVMGAEVEMLRSLKIGWNGQSTIDPNTSIEITQNTDNANGVKVSTYNNGIKAYSITRTDGKNTFVVYGDGKTYIGTERAVGHNSMLSVDGEISCKSLYVLKPSTWQDKVFMPDYKLQNLTEVESYIKINKHLPGIKSEKEILANGYDVNETDAVLLEKIENLYLYIIQQQKEIDALKNEIKKR